MLNALSARLIPILKLYSFTFAALLAMRLLLLALYPTHFSALHGSAVAGALLQGMRFDSLVVTLFFMPVLLALLMPLGLAEKRWWQRFWLTAGLLPLWALILTSIASLAYFEEVNRHIGNELLFVLDDWQVLLDLALGSRLELTVIGAGALLGVSVLWLRWVVGRCKTTPQSSSGRWAALAIALPILVLAGRGWVIEGKPLNIIDAYSSGDSAHANLVLTGAFSAFQSMRNQKQPPPAPADPTLLTSELAIDGENPFLMHYSEHPVRAKNVVVVLLESWSYDYIDGLAGKGFGVTPNMDKLVAESLVFDQHYAAAQRSIQGIQAILTGVAVLPGQPRLSEGLELVDMPRIGALAREEGYRSVMVQSSSRRSFRMDSVAASLGFDRYFGQEDIPLLRSYPQPTPRFGWDYDSLMFFHRQLNELSSDGQPFFGFAFTGTTHEPFADPGAEFHRHPHQPSGDKGFLNTLLYSDWALGEFMAAARQSPWYKDTLFIFTADHVLRSDGDDLRKQFHVPLILHAPGMLAPSRSEKLVSQYDLLPTMLDLMGVQRPFVAFGESIFRDDRPDEAWITKGNLIGLINHEAAILHSLRNLVTRQVFADKPWNHTAMERRLLSHSHLAMRQLSSNRWTAPQLN